MYKQAIVNNLIKYATAITNDNPDYIGYAINKYDELNRLKKRIGTVEGLLDTIGEADKLLTQDMNRRTFIGLTVPSMNDNQKKTRLYEDDIVPNTNIVSGVSDLVKQKLKSINMNRRQFISPIVGEKPVSFNNHTSNNAAVTPATKTQNTINVAKNKPQEQPKMSRRQFLFPFSSK